MNELEIIESIVTKLKKANIEVEILEKDVSFVEDEIEIAKFIIAKFAKEREIVNITFLPAYSKEKILNSNIENYKFIKGYEAIWSSNKDTIECELNPVQRKAMIGIGFNFKLRRLFNTIKPIEETGLINDRYYFPPSNDGIKISIGTSSVDFSILTSSRYKEHRIKDRLTIQIENVKINTHDEAKDYLEKIGNSFLFKLDFSINFGHYLAQDKEPKNRASRVKIDYDIDISFPMYEYDKEPISFFWYARSSGELPLLQFLAFYQILEFYFPVFSENEAHYRIKNILKNPGFNANKDSDIAKVLSTVKISKGQKGFGSELEQLKATVKSCINDKELKEFIELDNECKDYFLDKSSISLSKKKDINNYQRRHLNGCLRTYI
ncbi:hypothetical protein [Spirosoma foliorum]|uniref:Uncharacterized protein n=1 Tax=Spirosoma foliorum TaxID=2710596 RepID=A0A7G5H3H5_9BACT|nr:hypothetical protein [Spirosoma foliorum]QMW05667.1 hypothetical protein H3H32_12635 [Spirosoma foliorum]